MRELFPLPSKQEVYTSAKGTCEHFLQHHSGIKEAKWSFSKATEAWALIELDQCI